MNLKTKYILSSIGMVLVSLLYLFLIKIGIEKSNINLSKLEKTTGIIENFGIDLHKGNKGRESEVFFIKLNNLEKKVGVYRMNKSYEDLLKLFKIGEEITIYYFDNKNTRENVNIDLVQIERNSSVLLTKDEYEKKEGTLIYIGIGGLIANFIIQYYSRKKYLKETQNKSIC